MNNSNTDDKIFQLLCEMVENNEYLFDEGTAKYIIDRLPVEKLKEPVKNAQGIKNFTIKTNFWGFILTKNSYNISNNNKETLAAWRNLLINKDSTLVFEAPFIYTFGERDKKTSLNGNFSTYFAIRHLDKFISLSEDNFFDIQLNNPNKLICALEFLSPQQDSPVYFYKKDTNEKKTVDFIVDCVTNSKDEILKNKIETSLSFTQKLMSSENFKKSIEFVNIDLLSTIFLADSLGIIIKQSNDMDNVVKKPEMLGNLLALAPAEKWIEGWKKSYKTKQKEINIIEMFNNKIFKSYGINMTEGLSGPGHRKETYSTKEKNINALKDELNFLLPALSKSNISYDSYCHFFNSIMRTLDTDLMKTYLKHMDIPSFQNSEKDNSAYDKMINRFNNGDKIINLIKDNDEKFRTWKEWFVSFNAKKLTNELPEKQVEIKRKLKI